MLDSSPESSSSVARMIHLSSRAVVFLVIAATAALSVMVWRSCSAVTAVEGSIDVGCGDTWILNGTFLSCDGVAVPWLTVVGVAYSGAPGETVDTNLFGYSQGECCTGIDGSFEFRVPRAGLRDFTIFVLDDNYEPCLRTWHCAPPEPETRLGDIVIRPAARIHGRVVRGGQDAPVGAMLIHAEPVLDDQPGGGNLGLLLGRRAMVRDGGEFEFGGLGSGRVLLIAIGDGGAIHLGPTVKVMVGEVATVAFEIVD